MPIGLESMIVKQLPHALRWLVMFGTGTYFGTQHSTLFDPILPDALKPQHVVSVQDSKKPVYLTQEQRNAIYLKAYLDLKTK